MLLPRKLTAQMAATLAGAIWMAAATIIGLASADAVELHGAGSTFVAPLLGSWINYFERSEPNVGISYDAIGSGEGVSRFQGGSVDFGATDNFVSADEATKIERGVVQVPGTAGMIVLAYNLPGAKGRLKLPQDVYVDIFLGKIRDWNDPRIRAANPDLDLPAISIAVVCRRDSSGTTYAFTDHLAAVSKSWSAGPGVGKLIEWPHVAMLARGNDGVASRIKISQGAIGYMEYGFALRLGLPMAALENKAGHFVPPTPQSGAAALTPSMEAGFDTLDKSTVNPTGPKAYPIVTYSWLLLYRKYPAEQARALTSFIDFALGEGQSYAPYFGYLPLPAPVVERAKAVLAQFNFSTGAAAPASGVADKANVVLDNAPLSPTMAAPLAPSPPPARVDSYIAVAGDTFRSVAMKLYHNKRRWRDIANANPDLDPNRPLRVGQPLKLPEPIRDNERAR